MYHAFTVNEVAELKTGTRVTILRVQRDPDGPTAGRYDIRFPDGQVIQNHPGHELRRLVPLRTPEEAPARPREAQTVAKAPTATRHVCPACFSGVDVGEGGLILAHRYAAPTPWRKDRSACPGAGKAPFHTKSGLAMARAEASEGKRWGRVRRDEAKRVESGKGFVYGTNGAKVESPSAFDRQQYTLHLESLADAAERSVLAIQNRIDGWREEA